MTNLEQIINHHLILLDKSSSMRNIEKAAGKMADTVVEGVKPISEESDQEYRMTVLLFGNPTDRLQATAYDRDVTRTPTTSRLYHATDGATALNDAVAQALTTLQKFPEEYGDHAFILTVITDGEENRSVRYPGEYYNDGNREIRRMIEGCPDNFTITALVPGRQGRAWAEESGIQPDNIKVWRQTDEDVREVGRTIVQATQSYTLARSRGQTQTSSYFQPDVQNVAKINANDPGMFNHIGKDGYEMFGVVDKEQIKPFVQRQTGRPYATGSAYYQLTKRETIQASKRLAVRDIYSGELLSGSNIRQLLGLGPHTQMVDPAIDPRYEVYVQSTSVNRNLIPGQSVIVVK